MSVDTVNKFERHGGCSVDGIHVTAGRAETAMTSERNKLQIATFVASIHCTTERGIATVYHLIHVFDYGFTWMSDIDKFFIMLFKDVLKDVSHKTIMNQFEVKENPTPQD